MKKVFLPAAIFAVLVFAGPGSATDFKSGDVVVVSLPIGDDIYVAGGKVVISEPAAGDVVAACGSLVLNGAVGGDALLAGGSLVVNAPVGDDVRAGGGDIVFSSTVGGDLVVLGGNVTVPSGAVIEGNAVIAAGSLHLGGTVRGNLLVHGGNVTLSGNVLGDARIYAAESVLMNGPIRGNAVFAGPNARLGPGARFDKDVTYWREEGEMEFGQVPVGGQVRFDPQLKGKGRRYPTLPREKQVLKFAGGYFFGTLLSGIAVIVVMVLLLKGAFRHAGEALHRSYWKSTGIGFLTLLLLPIAAVLAMITVLGIPLGFLLLFVFLFSLLFGRVIAAMSFAAWLERRRVAEWSTGRLMLASIGVYILIKIVSMVPFVGWLAVLLAVLAGFGGLLLGLWRARPGY